MFDFFELSWNCDNFAISQSLTYNTKKINVYVSYTQIDQLFQSFKLNDNVIHYVENCKYLGIVIHLQSDVVVHVQGFALISDSYNTIT